MTYYCVCDIHKAWTVEAQYSGEWIDERIRRDNVVVVKKGYYCSMCALDLREYGFLKNIQKLSKD